MVPALAALDPVVNGLRAQRRADLAAVQIDEHRIVVVELDAEIAQHEEVLAIQAVEFVADVASPMPLSLDAQPSPPVLKAARQGTR